MSLSMNTEKHKGERIAKKIARAGLCSRRDAERWIADGRVSVNGKILQSPACTVTDLDQVVVDGVPLKEKDPARLFLYHKPSGLVTTHKDEKGRSTIFDHLPGHLPRVVSVGRLDLNTEGLLLLTNDGELSRYLELPTTGWKRKYRVRVHGKVDTDKLAGLKKGIKIAGVNYKSIVAEIDESAKEKSGTNTWLYVTLTEGKNREIRKVMEALGLRVNRLIRVSYGPFQLGALGVEKVEEVSSRVMKEQIKGFFGPAKNGAVQTRQNDISGSKAGKNKGRPSKAGSFGKGNSEGAKSKMSAGKSGPKTIGHQGHRHKSKRRDK
ncbi:MAG: pseudouridine synthase [Micavibrio sp.]|nr:pseudouridine synthase [Micavibrio sp.]